MPQYLMSVCFDDDYDSTDFTSTEARRIDAKVSALHEEMRAAGAWVFAGGLQNASHAVVARSDGATVSTTDGPYAETKEQIGGFWIVEAADLDAIKAWAAKATVACERPIEIRRIEG